MNLLQATRENGLKGLGWFFGVGCWQAGLAVLSVLVFIGCGGGGGPSIPPTDIVYEQDEDGDDVIDGTWTFVHNADGQIAFLEAEGRDDYTVDFSYDGDGNHELSEVYDDTGTMVMTFGLDYDADGNLVRIGHDLDLDSHPDYCMENTYNANGQITLMEATDCAGAVSRTFSYGWYPDGNMAWKLENDAGDRDLETYAYDARGNLSAITYDHGDDGVIDTVETLHWTPEAMGNENYINHMMFYDLGPFLPEQFLNLYRSVSHLTMMTADEGDDGTIDRANYFHYDAHGRMIRFETDENMDSVMDRLEYFLW